MADIFVCIGYDRKGENVMSILLIPGEIARMHTTISHSSRGGKWSEYLIALGDLEPFFQQLILSDLEEGNRATRKCLSCERLAAAPGWVQTIKCADLISNTSSIVLHDPDFAKVYSREKRELLAVLTKADRRLWDIANSMAGNVWNCWPCWPKMCRCGNPSTLEEVQRIRRMLEITAKQ